MVWQYLPQTNEKYYSVLQCPMWHFLPKFRGSKHTMWKVKQYPVLIFWMHVFQCTSADKKILNYMKQDLFVLTRFLCSTRSMKTKSMISCTAFSAYCVINIRSSTKVSWARYPKGTWRLRRTSSLVARFSWMNGLVKYRRIAMPFCALQAFVHGYLNVVCAYLNLGGNSFAHRDRV